MLQPSSLPLPARGHGAHAEEPGARQRSPVLQGATPHRRPASGCGVFGPGVQPALSASARPACSRVPVSFQRASPHRQAVASEARRALLSSRWVLRSLRILTCCLRCLRILTSCLCGCFEPGVPATGQPPPPWSCGVSALWAIAGQTLGSTLSLSLQPGTCPRESHFTPPRPELLMSVRPVSQTMLSLTAPRARLTSQL